MTRARKVSPVPSRAGSALAPPSGLDPTPLLLASSLEPGQLEAILHSYHIQRVKEADANLQAMAGEPHHRRQLAGILVPLLDSVSRTADPDQAVNHWERLLSNVSRSSFLEYLRSSPRMLDLVCTIFGNSDSLAVTLIRDPLLIYWLAEQEVLSKPPTRAGLERAIQKQLSQLTVSELKLDALRRIRRREMLRIGVRDVLKLADVPETTGALSDLASVLIDAAYRVVDADLQAEHGKPMHKNRQGKWVETGFTVIGMGKLGGHELNYSSDVDVLYICESHDGETRAVTRKGARGGAKPLEPISNEEYFEHVARRLTKAISEQTHEGFIFRVDLRLRAEGSVGQLTRSLEDYDKYYRTRGVVWERLALLKAWPIAGSMHVGKAFLRSVKPFIFGPAAAKPDLAGALAIVRDVRAVKDMIDAKMADRGHERRNVKLGVGGIREIEFLVQTIQVLAGKRVPALLDRSTLGALNRFVRLKLITAKERDDLTAAYVFLRDAEHKLQMVHDLQTHSLPDQQDELERCAIRMGYQGASRSAALTHFQSDHAAHTTVVHDLFRSLFETPETSKLLKATLRMMRQP
ncbi:MAG: hypothetical protein RI101_03875 [Nitrospira sp.]|jgi:glutamate-ammonia-ligase adenylyltransferase|nr:hypothetical protein [Nitrospira sp.]